MARRASAKLSKAAVGMPVLEGDLVEACTRTPRPNSSAPASGRVIGTDDALRLINPSAAEKQARIAPPVCCEPPASRADTRACSTLDSHLTPPERFDPIPQVRGSVSRRLGLLRARSLSWSPWLRELSVGRSLMNGCQDASYIKALRRSWMGVRWRASTSSPTSSPRTEAGSRARYSLYRWGEERCTQ